MSWNMYVTDISRMYKKYFIRKLVASWINEYTIFHNNIHKSENKIR
jgi:hypothetical protein